MTTEQLAEIISKQWNGAIVTDVVIDEEFGGVTATIDGSKCCDCGFIEDYTNTNTPSDTGWMQA